MRMGKWMLIAAATIALAPGTANALDGTTNADKLCLVNDAAVTYYCFKGRTAVALGAGPWTLNLKAGADVVVVRSNTGCLCSCDIAGGGVADDDFEYGGSTLTIYLDTGNDDSFGGEGTTTTLGEAGNDDLGGNTFIDTIIGSTGDDVIIDNGGGAETLQGDDDTDCLKDNNCSFTLCDCGGNVAPLQDKTSCGSTCTNCELTQQTCSLSCPATPFPPA